MPPCLNTIFFSDNGLPRNGLDLGSRTRAAVDFSATLSANFIIVDLRKIKNALPEIKIALPEIEASLSEIETALPEIETALPEIQTGLPKIEALSDKVENNYQPNGV